MNRELANNFPNLIVMQDINGNIPKLQIAHRLEVWGYCIQNPQGKGFKTVPVRAAFPFPAGVPEG
jgi:hypothetical protein